MTNQPDTGALDIAVSDFGPIVEANVDLRPMTVFVGPSNTGKSYLAFLLYAMHCFFGGVSAGGRRRLGSFPRGLLAADPGSDPLSRESFDALADWAETVSSTVDNEKNGATVDVLPETIASLIRARWESPHALRNAEKNLDAEIKRCFGINETAGLVRRRRRGKARVMLRRHACGFPPFEHSFTVPAATGSLRMSLPAQTPLRPADLPAWVIHEAVMERRTSRRDDRRPIEDLIGLVSFSIMRCTLGPASSPVHYLPADRTGLMHAHRVVASSLVDRGSRTGPLQDGPLPELSGVLTDFLRQLMHLDGQPLRSPDCRALSTRLERDILKGAIQTRQSETGYPSFLYRPDDWKDDLPLMNTSSMVSELAPVVLYLRDVVRPGDTLIIEEPESHLHPAMQVEFTRLLAATVKAGVRVVITTHSEWVLEALANLVRLSALPPRQRTGIAGADLALTRHEVGAWLFKPKERPRGTVVEEIPLDVEAGTFPAGYGEITEDLYNDWARISNLAQKAAER